MRLPKDARRKLGYSPTVVDVFCGCGGMSEGFRRAGFRQLLGVDVDVPAARSYAANFGCPVYSGPIESFVDELRGGKLTFDRVDVVVGGPPCQGFSPLGRMSAKSKRRDQHRSMNDLWEYFVQCLRILRPQAFVTENVREFVRSSQFEHYQEELNVLGYSFVYGVLDAYDFGVPQKRHRAFCIGAEGAEPLLPPPTGERTTVRDAIGSLPLEPDGENWHIGRNPTPTSLERYRQVPPGGNRFDLMRKRPDITPRCWLKKKTGTTDVFGRLTWDAPSSTIRTEFFKPEKGRYLHPEAHRPITHREAAALQTFPDEFVFVGSKTQVARQIGEAVPPKLAFEVARSVISALASAEFRKER